MDTLEDFIKKYRGTFVFLKTKHGDVLAKFMETNGDHLEFYSDEFGEIQLNLQNAWSQIDIRFPKTGLYNVGDSLFVKFYRIPERQWKRSPCRGNSAFYSLASNGLMAEIPEINYPNLMETFYPWYPTEKRLAKIACAKRGGVALNRNFGITLSDIADYNLFYGLSCIGTIKDDKIDVQYQPLQQEVIDSFGGLVWK